MFSQVPLAQDDPILKLAELYKKDHRPYKVDLGIGIYQDNQGKTTLLQAVYQAQQKLLAIESNKAYLPMDGLADFNRLSQEILMGGGNPLLSSGKMISLQTLGGSGALRIGAEFLKRFNSTQRVFISDPTWPNHAAIFSSQGFEILSYRYYDSEHNALAFEAMQEDLEQLQAGDVVVLHACCHNPTGIDPSFEQWQIICELIQRKGAIAFFDCAYQGFGKGLDEDALAIRYFAQNLDYLFIANSYSKNFGLYAERAGALSMITPNAKIAEKCLTQMKIIVRESYSTPPLHGAKIVAFILANKELNKLWLEELEHIRLRMIAMRVALVNKLREYQCPQNFDFILSQNGMFSFTGLSAEQIDLLQKHYAIYAVSSGRFNIAGINENNVNYVAESITALLHEKPHLH